MANNQAIEREFGWDDVIENDRGSWVLLPEGVYPFTVTGFKRERYGFQHVGQWSFEAANNMIARISARGWTVPPGIDPGAYQPT